MVKEERPGLELDFDDALQRREVRVQRIGWVLLALIIVAALAGLTGRGPLAKGRVARGGVDLRWERIARRDARSEVRLDAPAALARDGILPVRIGRAWADDVEIEDVRPEPERVSVADGHVEYLFAVPRGAARTAITFTVRPERMGRHELIIATSDVPAFSVRQVVLP